MIRQRFPGAIAEALDAIAWWDWDHDTLTERLPYFRDVRVFLYGQDFSDIDNLNDQFRGWLVKRSQQLHRSTGKTPLVLLGEEKLLCLPTGAYPPTRTIPAVGISKTALVEFETNHYTVPSSCVGQSAEIIAWPEKIEIRVGSQKAAVHVRCFERKRLIQNPLHAERLLERTGRFKYERILQLMQAMGGGFEPGTTAETAPTEVLAGRII